jgi:hypothetical protein
MTHLFPRLSAAMAQPIDAGAGYAGNEYLEVLHNDTVLASTVSSYFRHEQLDAMIPGEIGTPSRWW